MRPAIDGGLITWNGKPRRSILFRFGARFVERQQLHAREASPALELLLNDHGHSHVDDLISVAKAAQQAIARIKFVAQ
jgi:hypothetical protein